jgi:hypothetical protein
LTYAIYSKLDIKSPADLKGKTLPSRRPVRCLISLRARSWRRTMCQQQM